MNWFEVKVKYNKVLEDGREVRASEVYLVDALTCTEAEARTIEEMEPFVNGELEVVSVKKASYNEVFFTDNGDIWFKCKVMFVGINEQTSREKLTPSSMLIRASNTAGALVYMNEALKDTLSDYTIAAVSETKIVDVFPYFKKEE